MKKAKQAAPQDAATVTPVTNGDLGVTTNVVRFCGMNWHEIGSHELHQCFNQLDHDGAHQCWCRALAEAQAITSAASPKATP